MVTNLYFLNFGNSQVNFTYSSNCIKTLVRIAVFYCLSSKASLVFDATVRIIDKSIGDDLKYLKADIRSNKSRIALSRLHKLLEWHLPYPRNTT